VQQIHSVPAEFVKAQISSVLDDIGADAIKVGMLHSPEIVGIVAWAIDTYQPRHVVLDPVMVATSGDRLIAQETVAVLIEQLFPRVSLITPNLDEAAWLLNQPIADARALQGAAQNLLQQGARAVLLKGGHLAGNEVVDVLLQADGNCLQLKSPRIESHNVHGTGCTLSSAIAAYLALGEDLMQAVQLARQYILAAIAAGAAVKTGHGHGPLNHGHSPQASRIL